MSVPFVIEMKPHPSNAYPYRGKGDGTHWQVTRAGRWCGDFESFGKAQVFVNAMRYIEEVQTCGHVDAYPACAYLMQNVVSLE